MAVLLAVILLTASPFKARIIAESFPAQAIAANEVGIVGPQLQIDNNLLDLEARPSLGGNDQKLIEYMFSSVEAQLDAMRSPVLIGEGKIRNVIRDGTTRNGATAAEQISGAVVAPGEIFSFYDYVFPAVENGYVPGLTLFTTAKGQEWLPDIGGGICRTSTALNFAVQNAQLEVLERHKHTKSVTYAERGEDTAVARSAGWDYRFRNTTDKSIQIIGEQNGDHLQFKIYEIL